MKNFKSILFVLALSLIVLGGCSHTPAEDADHSDDGIMMEDDDSMMEDDKMEDDDSMMEEAE